MLGHDIAAALPELRAHAESRMTLTVRVESVMVAPDATGKDAETATVQHPSLPCRLRAGTRQPTDTPVAGSTVTTVPDELHFPWDTHQLAVGWRAVVISIGPLDPPSLLDRMYRLVNPHEGSQATAQRWGVESWATTT